MWVRTRGSGKGQTGCRRAFEGVMAELPNQRQVQGRVRAESTRPTADPSQGREEPEGAKVSRHWKKLAARLEFRDPGSIPGLGRSPEKGMATHSSVLAWRIPWTEECGGLQSMGLQRVGRD